ncbi:MAG: hypothetical protein KDE31_29070, partial [Caldilineaceae bacterium]|nr:hypothetical protein [Caldilineaceae bacterium]
TYLGAIGETGVTRWSHEHFSEEISKLAVDSRDRLYVADTWHNRIQVFDADGAYRTTIGGDWGEDTGSARGALGVAVDAQDNVYLVDGGNHRILQYEPRPADNWSQSNLNGFGDPNVIYVLASYTFNGHFYVGTETRTAGAKRLLRSSDGTTWEEVIGADFGRVYNYAIADLQEFKGQLYAGTWHWNWDEEKSDGGELWRSTDGVMWSTVITGGFGAVTNQGITQLIVFQDQLYATTAIDGINGQMQLWRSATGDANDWQQITGGPFANSDNAAAATLELYQDHLYLGTYNNVTGGELWRSSDGSQWTQVNNGGWGGVQTTAIASLEAFNGALYVGTRNLVTGGEIWRSVDGATWEAVATAGFGNPNNGRFYNLTNWNRQFYVLVGNEATGAEVWRSNDGASWDQISDAGWGDSNNIYDNYDGSVHAFDGRLYFGVGNWANGVELWRFNGDSITHHITDTTIANQLTFSPVGGGDVQLDLPADTVTLTLDLVYTPLTDITVPSGFALGHAAFDLSAYVDEQLQNNFTFAKPVIVTISYNDADVAMLDEGSLVLLWWNPQTQSWEDAACSAYDRQPAQNRLTVSICHLSRFGLFGETQAVFLPLVAR